MTFDPHANLLATGAMDNCAKLWDVETGEEIRRFVDTDRHALSLALSPDGRYLLIGFDDNTALPLL